MNKILTIVRKELQTYFRTPIAYIILLITISVFNIFFFMIIDDNREATLRDMFLLMEFMFVFIVPLLTMKMFAEEKANGTMEFMMTTPVTNTTIVLGKYLGGLIFFSLIASISILYYGIIECFAQPDRSAIWGGILGVWLEGAMFVAIGMLTSAWSNNQIIAAISSYAIIFFVYFSLSFTKYTSGLLQEIVRYISTMTHLSNFAAGLVSTVDVVYYLSGIVICILLTRIAIDKRILDS